MKKLFIPALLILSIGAAMAADAPSPVTVSVPLNVVDAQILLIAVANAGQACDIGVQAYCQIVAARSGVQAKMQAAFNELRSKTK